MGRGQSLVYEYYMVLPLSNQETDVTLTPLAGFRYVGRNLLAESILGVVRPWLKDDGEQETFKIYMHVGCKLQPVKLSSGKEKKTHSRCRSAQSMQVRRVCLNLLVWSWFGGAHLHCGSKPRKPFCFRMSHCPQRTAPSNPLWLSSLVFSLAPASKQSGRPGPRQPPNPQSPIRQLKQTSPHPRTIARPKPPRDGRPGMNNPSSPNFSALMQKCGPWLCRRIR